MKQNAISYYVKGDLPSSSGVMIWLLAMSIFLAAVVAPLVLYGIRLSPGSIFFVHMLAFTAMGFISGMCILAYISLPIYESIRCDFVVLLDEEHLLEVAIKSLSALAKTTLATFEDALNEQGKAEPDHAIIEAANTAKQHFWRYAEKLHRWYGVPMPDSVRQADDKKWVETTVKNLSREKSEDVVSAEQKV